MALNILYELFLQAFDLQLFVLCRYVQLVKITYLWRSNPCSTKFIKIKHLNIYYTLDNKDVIKFYENTKSLSRFRDKKSLARDQIISCL